MRKEVRKILDELERGYEVLEKLVGSPVAVDWLDAYFVEGDVSPRPRMKALRRSYGEFVGADEDYLYIRTTIDLPEGDGSDSLLAREHWWGLPWGMIKRIVVLEEKRTIEPILPRELRSLDNGGRP